MIPLGRGPMLSRRGNGRAAARAFTLNGVGQGQEVVLAGAPARTRWPGTSASREGP